MNDTVVNGRSPVTEGSNGVTTKFPDVCKTPVGNSIVPIPYTNVSKSSDLAKGSKSVKVNGKPVCLSSSEISTSTGDEAGSAKGIASGKTKGKAFPMNYSFDVKFDGKNVVRNSDPFVGNDRNTPPGMIMQAQVVVPPPKEEEDKCKYCKKEAHSFAKKVGTNVGSGQKLRENIISKIENHKWYTGGGSLEAHHLICSESMDDDDWSEYCAKFGYNINRKNNGVMLPNEMALACQLHAPLHRGNHAKGKAGSDSYPKRIKKELESIARDIKSGTYCNNPDGLTSKLDNLSKTILDKVDKFRWTITSDGKDYKAGNCGCAGFTSLTNKKTQDCPQNRDHGLARKKGKARIPRNTRPLEIGK
jgi:uncharacterized Zn-binding protein involved in type VI secretion